MTDCASVAGTLNVVYEEPRQARGRHLAMSSTAVDGLTNVMRAQPAAQMHIVLEMALDDHLLLMEHLPRVTLSNFMAALFSSCF